MKNRTFTEINKITTVSICCVLFLCACLMGTFLPCAENVVIALSSWTNAPSDITFLTTGDGTIANPYKISSAEQLATVSKNIATYREKSFKLTRNLDISKYTWVPIGTISTPYSGIFDGDGCSVSGIRIDANNEFAYAGLFGYLSNATIKNLTMVDEINTYVISTKTSLSSSYAGALAGYALNSRFENILNFNVDIYSLSTSLSAYAGGIVGYAKDTTFERTVNMGNVNSLIINSRNHSFAGGIVGSCIGGNITYARNDGKIYSYFSNPSNLPIPIPMPLSFQNSTPYAVSPPSTPTTDVITRTYAGGIAGYCETAVSLSYNTNEINSGINEPITIIGKGLYSAELPKSSYAGGIAGYTKNEVNNTYNLGNIKSNAITTSTVKNFDPWEDYEPDFSRNVGQNPDPCLVSPNNYFGGSYNYLDNHLSFGGTNVIAYGLTKNMNFEKTYQNQSTQQQFIQFSNIDNSSYATLYKDTSLAYSAGIAGYSELPIEFSYNNGEISGGSVKRSVKLATAISIYEISGSSNLIVYDFPIIISYYPEIYFGAITGNRQLEGNYLVYGSNDYRLYKEKILNFTCNKYDARSAVGNYKFNLISSQNQLGYTPTTYSFDIFENNDPVTYLKDMEIDYKISFTGNSTAKIDVYFRYTLKYRSKRNFFGYFEGEYMSKSMVTQLFSGNIDQKLNFTVTDINTLTTSKLGSTTIWQKNSTKNNNLPYLKEFYW